MLILLNSLFEGWNCQVSTLFSPRYLKSGCHFPIKMTFQTLIESVTDMSNRHVYVFVTNTLGRTREQRGFTLSLDIIRTYRKETHSCFKNEMGRWLFIGDVHGCCDEFDALIAAAKVGKLPVTLFVFLSNSLNSLHNTPRLTQKTIQS